MCLHENLKNLADTPFITGSTSEIINDVIKNKLVLSINVHSEYLREKSVK